MHCVLGSTAIQSHRRSCRVSSCIPYILCEHTYTHTANALIMQATRVGADTVLSQIVRLVERAQLSKAPIQAYADYVASIFVPVVVALAFTTWTAWWVVAPCV